MADVLQVSLHVAIFWSIFGVVATVVMVTFVQEVSTSLERRRKRAFEARREDQRVHQKILSDLEHIKHNNDFINEQLDKLVVPRLSGPSFQVQARKIAEELRTIRKAELAAKKEGK